MSGEELKLEMDEASPSWATRCCLRFTQFVLGPCLALSRSAAEKGSPYLTTEKIFTEEYPFWNIITEAGSGIKAPFLL